MASQQERSKDHRHACFEVESISKERPEDGASLLDRKTERIMKDCSKCKINKQLSDFYSAKKYKDGRYPSCKLCCKKATDKSILKRWGSLNAYYSEYRNRITGGNPSIIYSKKKSNAISHGIPFTLDREEFVEWYKQQNLKCSYCDIPQNKIVDFQHLQPNINIYRLTLDRIDCRLGYEPNNITLCCSRCNLVKSNFLTAAEMREVGQKYVKPRWQD